jgi:hypothetical protein
MSNPIETPTTSTTEETVIAAAVRYHERTGKWPTSESGDATEDFGYEVTWETISRVLFGRKAGYLDWFLRPLMEWRGVAPILRTVVVSWVHTGLWPTAGSMPGPFDGPWVTVDAALTLNGYAPLSKQIEQLARTVDREVILRNVSSSAIAAAAQRHHNRTGRWPTSHMDRDERVSFVPPSMIVTWGEVAAAVRQGLDGMSLDEMLGLLLAHYDGAEQKPSESSSAVEEVLTTNEIRLGKGLRPLGFFIHNDEWEAATPADKSKHEANPYNLPPRRRAASRAWRSRPLVADSLDSATWSKSVSFTRGLTPIQEGLSQGRFVEFVERLCEGMASDTGHAIQVSGSRGPNPTGAMLVRAAELSDGTWSVELRMREGWQTYVLGLELEEEASLAAQTICTRHGAAWRPSLFQPKPKPKPESATPTP